mmetsp:Transcript_46969/g.144677  ORF Transcript_46969/g.144677 Transcript_46969/m.144677 type:complete len:244 (-) Transcript_46969:530-1261(-)
MADASCEYPLGERWFHGAADEASSRELLWSWLSVGAELRDAMMLPLAAVGGSWASKAWTRSATVCGNGAASGAGALRGGPRPESARETAAFPTWPWRERSGPAVGGRLRGVTSPNGSLSVTAPRADHDPKAVVPGCGGASNDRVGIWGEAAMDLATGPVAATEALGTATAPATGAPAESTGLCTAGEAALCNGEAARCGALGMDAPTATSGCSEGRCRIGETMGETVCTCICHGGAAGFGAAP